MHKTLKIESMSNALILRVTKADGSEDGMVVVDDGSAAYKQLRAAFEVQSDEPVVEERKAQAEPTPEAQVIHEEPAEEEYEEPQHAQAGGYETYDPEDTVANAIGAVFGFLQRGEAVRQEAKANNFRRKSK